MKQQELEKHLSATYHPAEMKQFMPLIEEINQLKKDKNAVLLGHNYMTPEIFYGVSDIVGDSLYLSKMAGETDADIILFNGVYFMAETAKVLSPNKKVLIADKEAGCSLADSITRKDVIELKAKHPGVPVVTYVNSSAEVKAETDICCTSANAVAIVNSLDSDSVIFLPDEYLAGNVQRNTNKKIITYSGKCMVHELYTDEDIRAIRKQFKDVSVISHPECSTKVVELSDFSGSTSQMEKFIRDSKSENIFLITECSMGDNLRSVFPEKTFISTCHTCPHMKKISLKKIRDALKNEQFEVTLPNEIIEKAKKSVMRMLEISYKNAKG
ncbi:MAG: quinolinate synthase NadA [Leptospiraceae bacterium]|nr:quinolinate synthase NadA [Leptospiraceae bacterium]MCP5494657.1 quinolinate synthase NadA [Leptospiraceae bacterium]